MSISTATTAPASAPIIRPVGPDWWLSSSNKAVNSAPHAAMREATGDDVDCLVVMMRKLAQQEPSVPFDPAAVRNVWGVFLSRPEFGRAWLIDVQAKSVGYVILTLGFSFEYH